eukprot:6200173-Pleurochrysis_carterae.AAC.2
MQCAQEGACKVTGKWREGKAKEKVFMASRPGNGGQYRTTTQRWNREEAKSGAGQNESVQRQTESNSLANVNVGWHQCVHQSIIAEAPTRGMLLRRCVLGYIHPHLWQEQSNQGSIYVGVPIHIFT